MYCLFCTSILVDLNNTGDESIKVTICLAERLIPLYETTSSELRNALDFKFVCKKENGNSARYQYIKLRYMSLHIDLFKGDSCYRDDVSGF